MLRPEPSGARSLRAAKLSPKTSCRKRGFLPPPAACSPNWKLPSPLWKKRARPSSSRRTALRRQGRRRGPDQGRGARSARPDHGRRVRRGRKPCGHRRISGGRGSVAAGVLRRGKRPSRCLPRRTTRPFSTATPGPNTGGMGAYSPAPIVPDAELEKMADIAIRPILAEMARQGHPFHRYPLCRPDDDQRRPESFGIQRPFRRPGM